MQKRLNKFFIYTLFNKATSVFIFSLILTEMKKTVRKHYLGFVK